MIRYNWEVGNMKYEYEDVNLFFKKMVINTKEMLFTVKQVDELLHDPEFKKAMDAFSREQLEELYRLSSLYNEYGLELVKIIL